MNKFEKTFRVFKDNYKPIPLEIFGKDPYRVLVSVLLSSRTLDSTTAKAAKKLFDKAPDVKSLSLLSFGQIEKLIYPVGFYKTKAKQLQKLARMILDEFKGKIPASRENLMTLPGVGRKTANLVLNRAFEIPAIAVDTHVHHISNLLGWVKTTSPENTEKALMEILPKKYWSSINRYFVSIGQQLRGTKLKEFLKENGLLK